MFSRRISLVCTAALTATFLPAQQVHVVGPQIVPGVQFTSIQNAVDAAVDGDVILVRQGFYTQFFINNKALVVAGDAPTRVTVVGGFGGVYIHNTAAGKSVVVRNFAISSNTGVLVTNCQGPIAFEDCSATGSRNGVFTAYGASVISSSHVSFTRCRLMGGLVRGSPCAGLEASGAAVHLHSTTVIASAATAYGGLNGADGARIGQGSVHATRTTFRGGVGSPTSPPFCFSGSGGDALYLGPNGSADLLDCALQPGPGGSGGGCPSGPPGLPIGGTGTANVRPGVAGTFSAPSPVRAGQPLPLQLTGPPGDLILLAASAQQAPVFFAPCNGTIHPDLNAGIVLGLGFMPPSGQLTRTLQVPTNLGALAVPLHMQVVLGRPTGCFVADPVALLLLDASL